MRSNYAEQLDGKSGVRNTSPDREGLPELTGAEKWVAMPHEIRLHLSLARRTLQAIDPTHAGVLGVVYGPRHAGDNAVSKSFSEEALRSSIEDGGPLAHQVRQDFDPDLGLLVRWTPLVQKRRIEARDALAKDRIERATAASIAYASASTKKMRAAERMPGDLEQSIAWLSRDDEDLDQRRLHLEHALETALARRAEMRRSWLEAATGMSRYQRECSERSIWRGADLEVTSELVLHLALADTKDASHAAFVATVNRQADNMLATASRAYDDRWGRGCGRKNCERCAERDA